MTTLVKTAMDEESLTWSRMDQCADFTLWVDIARGACALLSAAQCCHIKHNRYLMIIIFFVQHCSIANKQEVRLKLNDRNRKDGAACGGVCVQRDGVMDQFSTCLRVCVCTCASYVCRPAIGESSVLVMIAKSVPQPQGHADLIHDVTRSL